jgi:hypothetical protein
MSAAARARSEVTVDDAELRRRWHCGTLEYGTHPYHGCHPAVMLEIGERGWNRKRVATSDPVPESPYLLVSVATTLLHLADPRPLANRREATARWRGAIKDPREKRSGQREPVLLITAWPIQPNGVAPIR